MPKNTIKFWRNLRREKLSGTNCLVNLRFAIFGLGDSSYPKLALATSTLPNTATDDRPDSTGLLANFVCAFFSLVPRNSLGLARQTSDTRTGELLSQLPKLYLPRPLDNPTYPLTLSEAQYLAAHPH